MKCIKFTGNGAGDTRFKPKGHIDRVPDWEAEILTEVGTWKYCPKSEWKAQQKKEG